MKGATRSRLADENRPEVDGREWQLSGFAPSNDIPSSEPSTHLASGAVASRAAWKAFRWAASWTLGDGVATLALLDGVEFWTSVADPSEPVVHPAATTRRRSCS